MALPILFPTRNVAFSLARLVINQLLPLAVLPYLLARLGAEPFGQLMMAQAVGWYAVVLVEYGFNLTGVRAAALARHEPARLHALLVGVGTLRLLIALVLALGLAVVVSADWLPGDMALLLLVGFIGALGAALQPLWFFQGLEIFPLISVVQLVARLTCLGSIFLLVDGPADLLLAQALMSAPFLVCSLVLVPMAHRLAPPGKGALPLRGMAQDALSHLREGWDIFLSQMATTLFTSTNTLVLGAQLGPAAAGHYAVADKLIRGVAMLSTPVTEAIYPRLVTALQQDVGMALHFARRVLFPGLAALATVGVALVLAAEAIATAMGPAEGRQEIATALMLMAFNPMAIYANNICGTQVLLGLGHKKAFRNIVLFSGASVPFASLMLIPWLGAMGAPAGAVIGEAVILSLMLWASQRAAGTPWVFKQPPCVPAERHAVQVEKT